MQALGFQRHGDVSVMEILDLAVPKPGPGELLIEVKASAFNHLDIWVREGWPGLKLALPHISGSDGAGVIRELGAGVEGLQIGQRVAIDPGINLQDDEFTAAGEHSVSPGFRILGEQLPGTHAEYVVVPAKNCLPLPEAISYELAAAAGLVSVTAWRMLINRAQIKVGEKVLVIGAGGGVNSVAIQLAKLAGCEVYGVTSTEEKMAKTKDLGADVVLNYRENANWAKDLIKLTNKSGFDVVVDNIGAATLSTSMRVVKRGGRIVIIGNTSGPLAEIDSRFIFSKQISLIGSTMGNHGDYVKVMNLVFSGKIKPIIDSTMPLAEGIMAMKRLEKGEQFGKIILTP